MRVARTIDEFRSAVARAKQAGAIVGLAPTMGALHEGHASLLDACRRDCGFATASIYVNPTQFGPNEDFSRYPRDLDADLAKCKAGGVDLVFAPDDETMYPRVRHEATLVDPGPSANILEGAVRPGHFKGVATVVLKLFQISQADRAYFGRKDFQQQFIIRKMIDDLNLRVELVVLPTVRESDGLAMSSRNRYLDPDLRRRSVVLWSALSAARSAREQGVDDAKGLRSIMIDQVAAEPSARLEYAEVRDAATFEPIESLLSASSTVLLLAARFGNVRLIDNIVL